MEVSLVFALSIRIISGLSIIFNIFALLVFCKEKKKTSLSNIMSLQLNIVCFITSFSYLIVPGKSEGLCVIQTVLNTFGEISRLTIVTTILFLAQLNFISSKNVENKKKQYLIASGIISWFFPILTGVLSTITGKPSNYSDFCWIRSDIVISYFYSHKVHMCLYIFGAGNNIS